MIVHENFPLPHLSRLFVAAYILVVGFNCRFTSFSFFFSFDSLLKGRESDGTPLGMEKFVRDSIKEFTYAESQLLQEMVRNIASVKPVS